MMQTASVFDSCVRNNPRQILLKLSRRRPAPHPFLLLPRRRKRAAKKGLSVLSSDASSSSNDGSSRERTRECSSSFEQQRAAYYILILFRGKSGRVSFVEKRQFFFSLFFDLINTHFARFARAFEGDDVSQNSFERDADFTVARAGGGNAREGDPC